MESDQDLMGRIQRGDAAAFDALFDRHGGAVRRRLAAIVRDEYWVEDLTQEVFLRLWTRCRQWSGRGSPAGWLGRIATNLALNHLRSQRRRPQKPLLARPDGEDDPQRTDWPADELAFDPAELLERAERLESFRRRLDALPEAKRAVMKMVYEEDMDIATVAEELGIPEGTVKSRLHYALKRLGRDLGRGD